MPAGSHSSGWTPTPSPDFSTPTFPGCATCLLGLGCFSEGFALEAAGSGSPRFLFS